MTTDRAKHIRTEKGSNDMDEKKNSTNPYVDGNKVYHNGDATYDLSDLTWEQINAANQIPAGGVERRTDEESAFRPDETPEERRIRSSQRQAKTQVPAGDAVALAEYMRTHPWAQHIRPPRREWPKTPAEIEAENERRLYDASVSGRMTHGEQAEVGKEGTP